MRRILIPTLLLGMSFASGGTVRATAQQLAFEVASIKRNLSGDNGGGGGPRGDRFTMRNVPLQALVLYAFRPNDGQLLSQQIIGQPEWMQSDRYDIDAKMSAPVPTASRDEIRVMVQALLENRLQMKWHRDTRELPVYNLVVAKGGLKMRRSADQTPPDGKQMMLLFSSMEDRSKPLARGQIRLATGADSASLAGNAVPIASLVTLLQGQADRMVFDATGLTGLYDFDFEYSSATAASAPNGDAPPEASGAPAPVLFTALAEIGLKLEPAKAPLPVIVIQSVQRPSEN